MPARYETIAGWVNEFGWRLGAELGVSDGKTHGYLLQHCPDLRLIGVDVWDMPVKAGATFSGERCDCEHCSETRAERRRTTVQDRERMARAAAAGGRSTLYKMTTVSAARKVEDGSLDFLFIDADHAKESVSADIAAWSRKVKPGGRVCGHDWNMKSVQDGVLEHYEIDKILLADDHMWYVLV